MAFEVYPASDSKGLKDNELGSFDVGKLNKSRLFHVGILESSSIEPLRECQKDIWDHLLFSSVQDKK